MDLSRIIIVLLIVIGLPVMAYLITRFSAAGYFRSKAQFTHKPERKKRNGTEKENQQ